VIGVCLLLTALILAVFSRTLGHEFVNYDDGLYVNEKTPGLTWDGIGKAFARGSADNWDPLTTLSHMVDCQLFGLNPAGHHLTNVLLHAATAMLLCLALRRMTRSLWPSAFVAAVFAIHPLRVESVAWVAERKDVLSGVFFMLTLWAYERYASGSKFQVPSSRLWYGCTLAFFTLSLLSKPMAVTLPFVLLLLDFWPLQRFTIYDLRFTIWRLVREKLPFFLLSATLCAVTLLVQMPSMNHFEPIPFPVRLGNALVSYVTYLRQTIWPAALAVFYPYPRNGWPLWQIVLSGLLLTAISAGAFAWRRTRPWLLVGWLWYLGMLVPVIGFVQVGFQAHADRYTYLPQIGLYLALTWTVVSLARAIAGDQRKSETYHVVSYTVKGLAVGIVAALSVIAFKQTAHWRDSESLWRCALACTADNATARGNLGAVLVQQGRPEAALEHYQKALDLRPDAPGHNNLGAALLQSGRVDDAILHFRKAVALQPGYAEAHDNLGIALSQIGQVNEAIREFQRALAIRPDHAESHYNLGLVLSMNGRADEAIVHLEKSLAAEPNDAAAHANLGVALVRKGRFHEATAHFETSLRLQPDNADTCKNLAWLLATCPDASARNGTKAIELAEKAVRLSGGTDPAMFGPLAAAYAEAGRFSDAVATAQRALRLAVAQENAPLVEVIQKRIEQYKSAMPVRDGPPVSQ
jgi:Flp pilus assembly protein TadD